MAGWFEKVSSSGRVGTVVVVLAVRRGIETDVDAKFLLESLEAIVGWILEALFVLEG